MSHSYFGRRTPKLTLRQTILEGLKDMPFAPGVQMKGIPNKSLGATLGIGSTGLNDPEDDVEASVNSEPFIACGKLVTEREC